MTPNLEKETLATNRRPKSCDPLCQRGTGLQSFFVSLCLQIMPTPLYKSKKKNSQLIKQFLTILL